jgi:hypothetical protein
MAAPTAATTTPRRWPTCTCKKNNKTRSRTKAASRPLSFSARCRFIRHRALNFMGFTACKIHHGSFDSVPAHVKWNRGSALKYIRRKRSIAVGAAWVAAYALVFNILLSGLILSALSPAAFAAGHVLCANSADIGTVRKDAADPSKSASVRCPICIANHVASALPPPPDTYFSERVATAVTVSLAPDAAFIQPAPIFGHQARGPPRLI